MMAPITPEAILKSLYDKGWRITGNIAPRMIEGKKEVLCYELRAKFKDSDSLAAQIPSPVDDGFGSAIILLAQAITKTVTEWIDGYKELLP